MNHYPESLDLLVAVPSQDGEFASELVEDDGLTYAADAGAYYRTVFELSRSGARLKLRATVTGKGFAEFQRKRFRVVFLNRAPRTATLDGRPLEIAEGRSEFENRGAPFEMVLEL
jgi:alpha-glucosidase